MKPKKSVALKLSPVLSILCTAWLALASVGVSAAPLNLTTTYPDFLLSSGQSFSYNAGTGILTINGLIGSYTGYTPPAPQLQVTNHPTDGTYLESFSLSAQLDGSGNVLSGSFRIDGFVRNSSFVPPFTACASAPYCEYYDGSDDPAGLLSGSLTEFGWSSGSGSNGVLEFRFDDADGIIADLGTGYHFGGMILTVQSSSLTNFGAQALTTSWTGTGLGDVFVVPVPAAAWLFLSGLGVIVGFAKRRGGRDRT
jgi:hypothetical protein